MTNQLSARISQGYERQRAKDRQAALQARIWRDNRKEWQMELKARLILALHFWDLRA